MTASLPPLTGRVLAAGKNYAAHVAAMADGQAPARPVFFSKPPAALRRPEQGLWCPPGCGELHPEAELVVLVGARLQGVSADQAAAAVAGYAAGLDMTDRALQAAAKAGGFPWEASKGFDGSAGLGPWLPASEAGPWEALQVRLWDQAGALKQEATAGAMTLGVPELLAYASERFTLEPGDVVFTGAPAGTEAVGVGDRLTLELVGHYRVEFEVFAQRSLP